MVRHVKGESGRVSNTLNLDKTFKLRQWLIDYRDIIKNAGMTRKEAADVATKKLGFLVTDRNITSVVEAAEIPDVVFKKRQIGVDSNLHRSVSKAALAKADTALSEVQQLRERLEKLTVVVEQIKKDLGM